MICSAAVVMRLVLDESLGKLDTDAVRALKRIERDVSGELTGSLALVGVDPSAPIDESIEEASEIAGLLGRPEREITRQDAHTVLVGVIERDLAFRAPRRSPVNAASTASAFLALFGGAGARFFTNGELGLAHLAGRSGAWSPLTNATFDTGVVAIDGGRLGVFWVEDED